MAGGMLSTRRSATFTQSGTRALSESLAPLEKTSATKQHPSGTMGRRKRNSLWPRHEYSPMVITVA